MERSTERINGYLHINGRGDQNHKLFGMTGIRCSFNCDRCNKLVKSRLPLKQGMDNSQWFCSFPCVKIARQDGMCLSAMMMHNQTQGHEVHLTSGVGWFCTTCDFDLMEEME